ncbi:RES family NAD+ phosphorylase [Pseudoduganella chitinolytica]|uniref:RES family NAD+ phosphorylase n=1 Tax=Pseudoduganella chitinolytica TaxID=34070 RepID=A0ABY8BFP3_9BURK|nr:RES family NAD+ phosphorylase [Pseudoduganella chitinolytica]WEF34724.1 RES family NAD+ phosphorylase [Pseudoduganella chitinolytica]
MSVDSSNATPPLRLLRQFDTCRLIPSRFADVEDSVLAPLADSDAELRDLFELDNATNARLLSEHGGTPGIGIDELLFAVPNYRIVNAAYTYARPEGSRFNDAERGAWYCGFAMETALAEVMFHKTVEYAEIDRFEDSVTYQAMLADFTAPFHDLRGQGGFADCLDPTSYVASQALAERLLAGGSTGIIYPSVRHAGGTCLACFRPALVGNVRKGPAYRLTWRGTPQPLVKPIPLPVAPQPLQP